LPNVIYQNPDNPAAFRSVGVDEAYLYKVAKKIIPTDANRPLVTVSQLGTTALLSDPNTSGIVWCQQNCNLGSNNQIGTPTHPVMLILDGPVQIHGVVWGFVFIRDTGAPLLPSTGGSTGGACPNNCALQMEAGTAIYGGLVAQGQIHVNGTAAVIYNEDVLRGTVEEGGLLYATLPGAWSDRRSY
jgi:hypothetical protein